MRRLLLTTISLLGLAGMATADVALIVGNENYDALRDLRNGSDVTAATDEFEALGFDVISLSDAGDAEMQDRLADFVAASVGAGRVLVVLAGRFMNSGQEAWLLGVDQGANTDLAELSHSALPLSTLLAVLAAHPGRALLLVGEDGQTGPADQPYLDLGLGEPDLPQGVTLVRGGARAIAGFAEDILPGPASGDAVRAARRQGLLVQGYAPNDYRFVSPDARVAAPVTPPDSGVSGARDAAAWKSARSADTIASYREYLRLFPDGVSAPDARRMIREIESEPNRTARQAEDALRLSRDQKRSIQRNLSILDFDPRGIDGLFGPGSRTAISGWQLANGETATGYLTEDQILRLESQGARRAAELEAEADVRRLEQERDDRNYWAATGAAGDEPGLRAYLKRYPDGVYAEVAQDRLKIFEDRRRRAAADADRSAWDRAVSAGTATAYRNYLQDRPNGAFADEARARIASLTRDDDSERENAKARRDEEALGLNGQTRAIIEGRLAAMDLKPGKVDGTFDASTRRAIRRYQQARNIPVTGYLTQQTVVRLMADSLFRAQ